MKYKKKPVIVEAYQITNDLLSPILFDGEDYPDGLRLSSCSTYPKKRKILNWSGRVTTVHGEEARVCIGDWIIQEPDLNHFYPCKPDIFEDTYDAAE